jgi:hypothetical protein
VSLVNPHDIMYFNTDLTGQKVQDTGRLMLHAAPVPEHDFYNANWDVPNFCATSKPARGPAHLRLSLSSCQGLGKGPPFWKPFQRLL